MKCVAVFVIIFLSIHGVPGAPWDFDFTFPSTYTKRTELLITDCNTQDMRREINLALGGSSSVVCTEEPNTNDGNHVTCADDSLMGPVLRLQLHSGDSNDPGSTAADRQRMEMKVFEPSPTELKAYQNQKFIYVWWFRLYSQIVADTQFFHIFQLKAVGGNDGTPLMTFTMTSGRQFHMRLTNSDQSSFVSYNIGNINEMTGQWVQAFVQVHYSTSGSIQAILKDFNGVEIYNSGRINHPMWWSDSTFVRPKYGLYRVKSNLFNPLDWQNFQNVQIWRE